MRCENIRELFSDLYDGVANEDDEIAAHLRECPECAKDYEDYCNLLNELSDLPEPDLPEGFHDLAMAKVREIMPVPRKKQNFYWQWAGAGAAACLIGISLLVSGISGLVGVPAESEMMPVPQAVPAPMAGGGIGMDDSLQRESLSDEYAAELDMPNAAAAMPVEIPQRHNGRPAAPAAPIGEVMPAMPAPAPIAVPGAVQPFGTERARADLPGYQQLEFNITIVVDDLGYAVDSLRTLSGHTLWSEVHHWDNGGQATIHRRVDSHAYAETQFILRHMGTVSHEFERVTHMTSEITDLEAQLIANRQELARLTDLLVASDNMEVLIAVEGRLGQVEANRDFLQGRMNQIRGMAAQPLVFIELRQQPHDVLPEPVTFGERIQRAFVNSIDGLVSFAEGVVVFLASAILPLLIVGAIAGGVWFVIRKRKRKGYDIHV